MIIAQVDKAFERLDENNKQHMTTREHPAGVLSLVDIRCLLLSSESFKAIDAPKHKQHQTTREQQYCLV